MMRHDTVVPLLADYVAGALDRQKEERVEAHAAACEECRGWLKTARFLKDQLACHHQASSSDLARLASEPETLGDQEYRRILGHLEVCEECRGELALTRRALADGRRPQSMRGVASRWADRVTWRPAAAAVIAAVLLTAAIGSWFAFSRVHFRGEEVSMGVSVKGERLIYAEGELLLRDLKVEEGGHLLVRATRSVAFGNGFTVGPGARLTVVSGGSPDPTRE